MSRFEVYTLRRTSSRTVYAVYDELASLPVCVDEGGSPVTSTSRRAVQELAFALAKPRSDDAVLMVAAALVGCGVPQGRAHRFAHAWGRGER